MLLSPQLAKEQICSRVPFSVNCNGIFVVDLNNVKDVRDVLVDDMGVWQWKGSYRVWCTVEDGEVVTAGKNQPNSDHAYQIWQRYYENKTSPDVKKYVVLLQGKQSSSYRCCLSFITLCRDLMFHLCLYDFFSFENRKDFVE